MAKARRIRRAYKPVVVTWHDAWLEADKQIDPEEDDTAYEPAVQHTIGWLFQRTKKGVTLVMEYDEDGDVRTRYFIPAGMVVRVEVLG